VCHTAAARRDHHDCRLAVLAGSPKRAVELLRTFRDGESQPGVFHGRKPYGGRLKVAFVYGADLERWKSWVPQLTRSVSGFAEAVKDVDAALVRVMNCSLGSLCGDDPRWGDPAFAEPVALVLQLALAAVVVKTPVRMVWLKIPVSLAATADTPGLASNSRIHDEAMITTGDKSRWILDESWHDVAYFGPHPFGLGVIARGALGGLCYMDSAKPKEHEWIYAEPLRWRDPVAADHDLAVRLAIVPHAASRGSYCHPIAKLRGSVRTAISKWQRPRDPPPHVFVNPSTGSWPSPFWLLYCDCIWRQGSDTGIVGKGTERQRWITYRAGQILRGTLERGPLYPMSSLMIHGIFINDLPLFGNPYDPKSKRPTYAPEEITAEVRSFFATGVNLQELYVNPRMMSPRLWDLLAETARWSRANAGVMADTHWIGGDPAKNEAYGYPAWTPHKALLTLRNPDERAVRFALDVERAFELPPGAPRHYRLTSPWADDTAKAAIDVRAGQPRIIALRPFETLVLDATPLK
jgi:hypothetical protein